MFILIVAAFVASIVFTAKSVYFNNTILAFMGVIFMIVFVGWIFGFFCSCRGTHWHRHGYDWIDSSRMVAKKRYAEGEITRSEYNKIISDLK